MELRTLYGPKKGDVAHVEPDSQAEADLRKEGWTDAKPARKDDSPQNGDQPGE